MVWTTQCPAKLNLFLSVGPKDSKGWHPLRTIFQAIDLYDHLSVTLANVDQFTANVDYLPPENTVFAALSEFRKFSFIPPLSVKLQKTIPAQSGLGGGSSDAAGMLRILQKITHSPLSDQELLHIASKIGADVPFFLMGGKVRAEGYGEIMTALEDSPECYYVVIKPEVDCSTPLMFRALDDMSFSWKEFSDTTHTYNDFERVMPQQCAIHLDRLSSFEAISVGLSGSGSAVFGQFENQTAARTALTLIKDDGEENAWLCRSLNRDECHLIMTDLS